MPAIHELHRYFYLNVPQVLLLEILADLSNPKYLKKGIAKHKVSELARKVLPPDTLYGADHKWLCVAELFGGKIPLNYKPILPGGKVVKDSQGRAGVLFGVSPQNEAILRWQHGDFTPEDYKLANNWREYIGQLNFEEWKQSYDKIHPPPSTLEDIIPFVDMMLNNKAMARNIINSFLKQLRIEHLKDWFWHTWSYRGKPEFKDHVPLSMFCMRLSAMFHVGVGQGVLSSRNSNHIDLEYLCNLPFTQVFGTSDKFQTIMAQILINSKQSFVSGLKLRNELTDLAELHSNNDISDTPDNELEPKEGSIIHNMWVKHLGGFTPQYRRWKPTEDGKQQIKQQIYSFDFPNEEHLRPQHPTNWPHDGPDIVPNS